MAAEEVEAQDAAVCEEPVLRLDGVLGMAEGVGETANRGRISLAEPAVALLMGVRRRLWQSDQRQWLDNY